MGNAKNRKVVKKRKQSKKSMLSTSSDQKENKPKNHKNKVTKLDPNNSIAMSKQLLLKRSNNDSSRRTSSKNASRVCANGKPIPSLAELEKMYEDSDDDEERKKAPNITLTPENQSPVGASQNTLPSPTTIAKISDQMMTYISNINPIELFDVVASPPPVIPAIKRKTSGIPYIVGCEDRPKVESKPSTNFCKGDDDYGVHASNVDQEDSPPAKRARKSNIPNHSKSIFNAKCDEIAVRLTTADAGGLSDGSTESNKTIIYDPKQTKGDDESDGSTDCKKSIENNQSPSKISSEPYLFTPLPSTSKDNATFLKNDELFNASLRENNDEINDSPAEKENEGQMVENNIETIVIDDGLEEEMTAVTQNTSSSFDIDGIEIIEPTELNDDVKDVDTKHIKGSMHSKIQNNSNDTLHTPILIDDEYSDIINDTNYTYTRDSVEIIDVDDVIAENKSILDKWKTSKKQESDKIVVVDVPTTCKDSTTSSTRKLNIPLTTNLTKLTAVNTQPNAVKSTTPLTTNTTPPSRTYNSRRAVASTTPQIPIDVDEPVLSAGPHTNSSLLGDIVSNFFTDNQNPRMGQNSTQAQHKTWNDISIESFIDILEKFVNITIPKPTNQAERAVIPIPGQSSNNNQHTRINTPSDRNQTSLPINSTETHNDLLTSPDPPRLDCPICLDPIPENRIASTMCGHVFCLQCIKSAIVLNGKKCPTCRKILRGPGGGYHQLFL